MEWISDNLNKIFETSDRNCCEKKTRQLLEKYYPQVPVYPLVQRLSELTESGNFEQFYNIIENMHTEWLYVSCVHGQAHAERVSILSWMIMEHLNVETSFRELVLKMTMYHDVGRLDDSEDSEHGIRGAVKMRDRFSEYSEEERNLIFAVIEAHSLRDEEAEAIYKKYFGDNKKYQDRYKLALDIVKDADALDRFRLRVCSLNTKYLRLPQSHQLISAACEMYLYQSQLDCF